MKAAVIGYGSIGQRHTRILRTLAERTAVVSKRPFAEPDFYTNIAEMMVACKPNYIVIANETSSHAETLRAIHDIGFDGRILVEKPLFHHENDAYDFHATEQIFVAYNLRFHPILLRIHDILQTETVISANIYTGQYLPSWRPNTNYAESYSASKAKGGGVIRDLSHELDYMLWLFGGWQSLTASGGKISNLQIDSDDHFSAILHLIRGGRVLLHINYLDRIPRRQIIINTNEKTIVADLVAGTLRVNDDIETFTVERDETYRRQHLEMMSERPQTACTFTDATRVLQLISAMEHSSERKEWINQ